MTPREGMDIVKGIDTIALAFGQDFQAIASWLALGDERKTAIINEAITLHNKFRDASIVERGAMLGIQITENRNGDFSSSAVLSETSDPSA